MAKRKLTQEPSGDDSDLSLPPEGLLDAVPGVNGHVPAESHSKRRRNTAAGQIEAVLHPSTAVSTPSRKRKLKVKVEEVEQSDSGLAPDKDVTTKATPRKRKSKVKEEAVEKDLDGQTIPLKKRKKSRNGIVEKQEEVGDTGEVVKQKVKRKRKTQEEKDREAMPLAARTVGHKLYIGAHISSAGGVHNAVTNSVHIGANAFALFLKSQRKWANPPLIEEHCSFFRAGCETHTYDQMQHVVPHGSYLVNLAHTDKARTEQAYDAFIDDLKRCERLGIKLYNFHPGNSVGNDRAAAIAHLASSLNRAHKETDFVVPLLENMAAGKNVLGSTFEDLRDIIHHVEDKERIGVCLDTCHAFAAGYDLRDPAAFKATMDHFDELVGFKYLRALHLNDSKAPFGAHRDLHANIGTGFLGLRAFHNVVNEPRFAGLPLILETPIEVRDADGLLIKDEKGKEKENKGIWAREIKMLERLVGMDVGSEEFLEMERRLARQGEPERRRLMEQQDRKKVKLEKAEKKGNKKKKGDIVSEAESSLSELEEGEDQ